MLEITKKNDKKKRTRKVTSEQNTQQIAGKSLHSDLYTKHSHLQAKSYEKNKS